MNKRIYLTVFGVFCLIMSGLLYYIGMLSRELYLESEITIIELQKKHKLVASMETIARERSYLLINMFNEKDVFIRDEFRIEFDRQAFYFIKNRDEFIAANLNENEIKIFEETLKLIRVAEVDDADAADFMMAGNMLAAERILFNYGIPRLYKIIENFSLLLDVINNDSQAELSKLREQLKHNLYIIILFTIVFVFTAVILIYIILERLKKGEDLLTGSEAFKNSILDTAIDAILSVNKAGIISRFNKSAENMFGYQANEIIGKSIELILLEEFKMRLNELQFAETENKLISGISHEVSGRHKNGENMPLQISMSDTGIVGGTQFSLIIRDLTKIKKTEENLKHRTQELEFANKKYKQLSETDPLTQIPNRRVYEARITSEINAAKRLDSAISLLMIDVDFFKKYNDNYGHDSGDVALVRVAKTIVESLPRSTDLAVRFGGEEFLVLMPLTDIEGAITVAERIRSNVKALAITHAYSDVLPVVTVSIGVASLMDEQLNEVDLLKQADSALYAAKEAGRNCCKTYTEINQ